MFKKRFYFIVFEGIEGTGKSYQINKLYKNLIKHNFKIIKTREPGGSKTAEKIRNLIFSGKFDKITDFYLLNAARNEHVINTIEPAKKDKKIVLCDRFTDSTFAYQVAGNKISKNINKINQNYITKNIKPDLTIILKSNNSIIVKRLKKRKKNNKFDKLKFSFYGKAQNAFLKLAKKNKRKYVIFDSSKNDNKLEKIILSYVLKKLSK